MCILGVMGPFPSQFLHPRLTTLRRLLTCAVATIPHGSGIDVDTLTSDLGRASFRALCKQGFHGVGTSRLAIKLFKFRTAHGPLTGAQVFK